MNDDLEKLETHEHVVRLSVIIPCYNEEKTLETCFNMVVSLGNSELELEIIIIDDGSNDDSLTIAKRLSEDHENVVVLKHDRNRGKGAALKAGFDAATGDIIAIQDGDLEYDPADLKRLIEPILRNQADIVFGSRFSGGRSAAECVSFSLTRSPV